MKMLACGALHVTLVAFAAATQNQPHTSADAQSVQATVTAFYKWYVHAIIQNRDPLTDERPTLQKYVAPALLARIDKMAKSPDGLDADYFIQAQDYFDDWETDIIVAKPWINHTVATVTVTLGANGNNRHRLKLTLTKTADAWKIRRIQALSR